MKENERHPAGRLPASRSRTETTDSAPGSGQWAAPGTGAGERSGRPLYARRRPKRWKPTSEEPPDGCVERAGQMRAIGLTATTHGGGCSGTRPLDAAALGTAPAGGPHTQVQARPLPVEHGAVNAHDEALVEDLVRSTHGLVGAGALARSGWRASPRRMAGRIKSGNAPPRSSNASVKGSSTRWSSPSRASCAGIRPALRVPTPVGRRSRCWCLQADACVPYRTEPCSRGAPTAPRWPGPSTTTSVRMVRPWPSACGPRQLPPHRRRSKRCCGPGVVLRLHGPACAPRATASSNDKIESTAAASSRAACRCPSATCPTRASGCVVR